MQRSGIFPAAWTASLLLLFVVAATAQDQTPVLQVRAANGQTRFQTGERIPLELLFTGPANTYDMSTASYDRSGRLSVETFEVQPSSGWADPLARYFAGGAFIMGGLSGMAQLKPAEPVIVTEDLNQWVRFDQPGTYRITVSSTRITKAGGAWGHAQATVPVRSKPLELQIVAATPEWQAARLQAILTVLHAPAPQSSYNPSQATKDAVADLRYLTSSAAIEEMARGIRDDRPDLSYSCEFGIMGVPDALRETAIKAIDRRLDDPEFPVSTSLLMARSTLESHAGLSPEATMAEREQLSAAAWSEALRALSRKVAKARAATAETLFNSGHPNLSSADQHQLAAALASSLSELPEDHQAMALRFHWDDLREEITSQALARMATLALAKPASNEMGSYSRRDLKSAALERWYEVEPDAALREVRGQIGSEHPGLPAQSLLFLPQDSFPELEAVWAQALLHTENFEEEQLLTGLLAHFGVGGAATQVREKLESKLGHWACFMEADALAYLVRFDPDNAALMLRQALAPLGEGKAGCSSSLLSSIATRAHGPLLTEVATETLDNPDVNAVMDALNTLRDYGNGRARDPILQRYFAWSERWAGRAAELEKREPGSFTSANWKEVMLGQTLAVAAISSQGWLADQQTIARVLAACVIEAVCMQVRQIASFAPAPYRVSLYRFRMNGTENYQVAQYTTRSLDLLEEKLRQFPQGTEFLLPPQLPISSDDRQLELEARAVFERTGQRLTRVQPETAARPDHP